MADIPLCLFRLPDGSFQCTACNQPPEDGTNLGAAPRGLEEGVYTSEDLKDAGYTLPQEG